MNNQSRKFLKASCGWLAIMVATFFLNIGTSKADTIEGAISPEPTSNSLSAEVSNSAVPSLTPCQECMWNIADYYHEATDAQDPRWQNYILTCNLICLQERAAESFNKVGAAMSGSIPRP